MYCSSIPSIINIKKEHNWEKILDKYVWSRKSYLLLLVTISREDVWWCIRLFEADDDRSNTDDEPLSAPNKFISPTFSEDTSCSSNDDWLSLKCKKMGNITKFYNFINFVLNFILIFLYLINFHNYIPKFQKPQKIYIWIPLLKIFPRNQNNEKKWD